MTSLRFATAVHILVLLAHLGADTAERAQPSSMLAKSIGANPVVVRRLMAALAAAGLIHTKAGSAGGAWLARPADAIRVSEIYTAVEEGPAHASRPQGAENCPVGRAAPGVICGLIRSMDEAAKNALASRTLADVVRAVEAVAAA